MGTRSPDELAVRHTQRLRAELVRLLFESSGIALVTTPAASITLAVIGASRVRPGLVAAWVAYVVIVALARAELARRYRRRAAAALDVTAFERLFVAGAFAAGLGWGMAGLLFFFPESAAWQMFLALLIAGVAVASVPVLAPVMAAFLAFTIPTLVPITVRFLWEGTTISVAVAALAVIFLAGLAVSVLRLRQAMVRALVLAFENRDLVAELSSEVTERARVEADLREARDALEERVRARTRELQQIVAEQRRAEDHLRTLIEASPLAIVELDLQGTVKTWNRAATQLFGWTEHEVIGLPYPIVPDDKEDEYRRLLGGDEQQHVETRRKRKDGTFVDVVLSVAPVRDAEGRPIGTTAILTDVTDRKRLEAELRQSQKMDAVGRLAGGVAHDFNNLLTVIIGRSESALSSVEGSDPTRLDLELILATAERAAALTRQLLAFSRRQVLQPKLVPLREIVGNVVPMLRRLIGEDIQIHTEAGGAVRRVRVDPGQIEQVIVNLALNARDAMPQGGLLTITSTTTETHAILSVSDTGPGMDEETRTRAFEPFFTTKPLGKGTGLGLSMAYGIVEQHGGTITIESMPDRGTTLRIHLPLVDEVTAEAATTVAAEARRGTETVLLVEDETEVREMVAQMLRRSGYTVLVAPDGPTALRMNADHTGPIHLLLTDVVMPEMSGFELSQRLGKVRPETKIVYMSGYTDEALRRHGDVEPDIVLLQKPFRLRELVQRIREVLDA